MREAVRLGWDGQMSLMELKKQNKEGSFSTEEKKEREGEWKCKRGVRRRWTPGELLVSGREDKTGSGQLGSDCVTSQHLNKRIQIQLNFHLFTWNMLDYRLGFSSRGSNLNDEVCNFVCILHNFFVQIGP